jgi:hypothetical protein
MAGLSPRRLPKAERLALDRHSLAQRWGLGDATPSLPLLDADRDGLREHLRLGWLLTCPEARALIPAHDAAAGRPWANARLRVALAPRVKALEALGMPRLLERFAGGEVIAATDPALLALHATATAGRAVLSVLGVSPGKLPSGTLRNLLRAVGWELTQVGRFMARQDERGAYLYSAAPLSLPEGVGWEALTAIFLRELHPLSPAAQSVWDAFNEDEAGIFVDYGEKLAAALRAAVDQVLPEQLEPSVGDSEPWPRDYQLMSDSKWEQRQHTRAELLAIADELEGRQP